MIRGRRRSGVGPGTSARKSCIPPTPRKGSTAITSTMIPMPPSQWVRERQKRMPWGSRSMLSNTVAPVVVNPDMDSKSAAQKECSTPVHR